MATGPRPRNASRCSAAGAARTIDDFRRARVSGRTRVRHGRLLARQDKGHAAEMAAFVARGGVGRRLAGVIGVSRQHDARHLRHRSVAGVGRSGARAMTDASASQAVRGVTRAGDGAASSTSRASLQVYAQPSVGSVVVLVRSAGDRTRPAAGDARQYFMRFQRESGLRGSVRCGRHSAARLPGPHRTAVQPDRDRAVRSRAIQPLVRERRRRRPHRVARRVAVARREPAAQRPRRAGVAPPLRLAVPAGARRRRGTRGSRRETACRCSSGPRPRPATTRLPMPRIGPSSRSSCRCRRRRARDRRAR